MKKIAFVSVILSAVCAPGAFAASVIEPVMAIIPAGQFMMGNPTPSPAVMGSPSDGPAHKVSIKTFKLSKYELTVKEFRQFVESSKYVPVGMGDNKDGCWKWVKQGEGPAPDMRIAPGPGRWNTPAYAPSDYHPVMCVSVEDGKAYAKWLSKKTGKKYRLPSEAEWEYAARSGGAGSFPASASPADICRFGNVFDKSGKVAFQRDLGWERKDGDCDDLAEYTTVVGMYEPNALGLHDMTGNVAEYVEDCQHADYAGAPTDGTAWVTHCDPKAQDMVIRRGGGYGDRGNALHFTSRAHAGRTNHSSIGDGLRLVQQIDSAADLRAAHNPFQAELAKAQQAERVRRTKMLALRQSTQTPEKAVN